MPDIRCDDAVTRVLTVRIKRAEFNELRRIAAVEDRSMSSVLRRALKRVLDERRGGHPEIRA